MSDRSAWRMAFLDRNLRDRFLAEPVLKDAFPQGLEGLEPAKKTTVRQAYDEWREALTSTIPTCQKFIARGSI